MLKIVPISFHAVFQFHYGTIKSTLLGFDKPTTPDFNSTMVRLKVIMQRIIKVRKIFQFHYGTIKR